MKKNSTAIYRTLLREAWRLTWQRKTLWIFGIFAALVSTGGVLDMAVSGVERLKFGGSYLNQIFQHTFIGSSLFRSAILYSQQIGTIQAVFMILFIVFICFGAIFLGVLSQTSLIHGIKSEEHEHPNIIRKRAHDHLFRIFLVDLVTKIIGSVLIVATTLPLIRFVSTVVLERTLQTFGTLCLFFPAILVLNILSFLTIIDIIKRESTIKEAFLNAWSIFTKHWLATIEYAIMLFFLISLSGFVLFALTLFLSIPYALIYSISLLSGSIVVFITSNILFGLCALAVILSFGGALVTFQYTAWYLFYEQSHHLAHKRMPISKTLRMLGIK
ncbi:MAG: hypothetical protein AAB664_03805 [Patescibacteria group bacterium]